MNLWQIIGTLLVAGVLFSLGYILAATFQVNKIQELTIKLNEAKQLLHESNQIIDKIANNWLNFIHYNNFRNKSEVTELVNQGAEQWVKNNNFLESIRED